MLPGVKLTQVKLTQIGQKHDSIFRRTPLLQLSPVSTFPRLEVLKDLEGRSFSRDSGKSKLWGLFVSLEFLESERECKGVWGACSPVSAYRT